MNRRRKNNIVIGTLCAVLVLMGVGYAILSTTLNIGGIANITGDFDIHFTNIQRSSSTITDTTLLSTMDNGTGIKDGTNNHEGTFTAVLQKPTDYVIYEVEVANTGSIDGYLTFTFGDKHNNFDYYKDFYSVEFIRDDVTPNIKADILQNGTFTDNEVLENTTGTRTYKIKVTFKESATNFPDATTNGEFECTLNLTYSQQAPVGNSGGNSEQSEEQVWRVDSNGLVISYNPADFVNGTLSVPAVDVDNNPIRSIGPNSFLDRYNVAMWEDNNDDLNVIVYDTEHFSNISEIAGKYFETQKVYSQNDIDIPSDVELAYLYINPTKTIETFTDDDIIENPKLQITTLDLSYATSLTTIGDYAFYDNSITTLDLSHASSLTTIGEYAFQDNSIESLTIPSSVTTIGVDSFSYNSITTLDLSHASSLTVIGQNAFYENNITTLDLSNATSLTTIGINAFGYQRDKNDSSINTLQSINAGNKTKAEYDTMSDNSTWYDDGNSNFHIQYSNVTCDRNNTCVDN